MSDAVTAYLVDVPALGSRLERLRQDPPPEGQRLFSPRPVPDDYARWRLAIEDHDRRDRSQRPAGPLFRTLVADPSAPGQWDRWDEGEKITAMIVLHEIVACHGQALDNSAWSPCGGFETLDELDQELKDRGLDVLLPGMLGRVDLAWPQSEESIVVTQYGVDECRSSLAMLDGVELEDEDLAAMLDQLRDWFRAAVDAGLPLVTFYL